MHNDIQQSDPITLVISEIVKPGRIQEYEIWAKGINQAAKQFNGFVGVDVIRPRDRDHVEYVVILKFDNYTNFRNWWTSSIYQEWIRNSRHLVLDRVHQQQRSGLEMWFTLPANTSHTIPQPAYYKQVILGTIAVYPLILCTNAILNPFLKELPSLLALLISVIVLSALLTYPVMPWLTRLLSFWLYPNSHKIP